MIRNLVIGPTTQRQGAAPGQTDALSLPRPTWRTMLAIGADPAASRPLKLAMFAAWLALAVLLTARHAYWRDEVRALSLALSGPGLSGMFRAIHGEGHPFVWYALLRAAHVVTGNAMALPVVALAVAAATMLLLVLRGPFAWWIVALLLASDFALHEYSVMARNYGISVLLMFLLAECYPRRLAYGMLPGCLLFLLANTNAHSVLLAGAYLLFWFFELIRGQGLRWSTAWRDFAIATIIAAAGVVICLATLYPPANDAAAISSQAVTPRALAEALLLPGGNFGELLLDMPRRAAKYLPWLHPAMLLATSALLFGATAGLLRRPGALLAALASLLAFSLFFTVVYTGYYRHDGLWLYFVISLYWIMLVRGDAAPSWPQSWRTAASLPALGTLCLVALLALQVPRGAYAAASLVLPQRPDSRSRDLAQFIETHPALHRATLLSDQDYMLEPLPRYVPNQLYFLHEQRLGRVVKFTLHARLSVSLGDMVAAAGALREQTGQPVLMLMTQEPDPAAPAHTYRSGYHWVFETTPEQVREFLAVTHRVARFGPAVTDETYTVYELD